MSQGIRDKVAIIGMGCSRFGERWDAGSDELMVEAFSEAIADAGIEKPQIEAAWFGSAVDPINVGNFRRPARLRPAPAQHRRHPRRKHVRHRHRSLARRRLRGRLRRLRYRPGFGRRKTQRYRYGGLPVRTKGLFNDLWMPYGSAPGTFAQLAGAYAARHAIAMPDLKAAMAHIS